MDELPPALDPEERLAVRQALTDELCATGLGDDDSPNQRGMNLESLIDYLAR